MSTEPNDPVGEAVERANNRPGLDPCEEYTSHDMFAAAREALAPIRELIEAHTAYHQPRADRGVLHSQGVMHLIRDLTPLLYAEDEVREPPAPNLLRAHPAIPVPPTVPERTAARFAGAPITPEENP